MSDKKITVNVEQIMGQIRRDVQIDMDEDIRTLPAFESVPLRETPIEATAIPDQYVVDRAALTNSLRSVNGNYDVPYYWDMGPRGLKTLLKRVVRKLIKCQVAPGVARQNVVNADIVRALNGLYQTAENERNRNAVLCRMLDDSRQTIGEMYEKIRTLKKLQKTVHEQSVALENASKAISALEDDMDRVKRFNASFNDEHRRFERYSQAGEDSIIAFIFEVTGYRPNSVSYLDLGANHARDLSNTYYFYQCGASGVLVEANPDLIPELEQMRPRDIVLNRCVSDKDGETVDFYLLSGDGLSTCSKESADHALSANDSLQLSRTVQVETISVNQIMKQYFRYAPVLLNVDIEGYEMEVLRAIDFTQYRPLVIIAEVIPYETGLVIGKKNLEVGTFLQGKGYVEYAFTGINSIFVDAERIRQMNNEESLRFSPGAELLPYMKMNEHAGRSAQGICLRKDGLVYGPYVVCPAGEYVLTVETTFRDENVILPLYVKASKGNELLASGKLLAGVNEIRFSLPEEKADIEFVLPNDRNGEVFLNSVKLS